MRKKNKILITTGTLLATGGILLGAYALNGSGVLERTNDVTPPYGKVSIKGATETNNINYVDRTSIEVEIYAKDDTCSADEIKYYLSTSPISDTEKIEDSLWKDYYEGAMETINLPSLSSTNTIYAIFKDKAGNTSTIYTGENTEYTITYDANGGTNAPLAQTVQYGMPFYIPSSKPAYEGKYFVGWSEVKGTTMADYEGVEIYAQNEKIGANSLSTDKNITLYAVWTEDINELPSLADVVEVGDYVNYPVYYENVNGATLKGWRVLSKDVDIDGNPEPGTVNLVSAGIPLTYYPTNNKEMEKLALNFFNITFDVSGKGVYKQTGFNPYTTLEEIFNNKYTSVYEDTVVVSYTSMYRDGTIVTCSGEKQEGDLKVRGMTKEDVDKVYDPTGATIAKDTGTGILGNEKYQKLLSVGGSYILASAFSEGNSWFVGSNGRIMSSGWYDYGVRPVVSLNPTVKTTGTDIIGAWDIEVAE